MKNPFSKVGFGIGVGLAMYGLYDWLIPGPVLFGGHPSDILLQMWWKYWWMYLIIGVGLLVSILAYSCQEDKTYIKTFGLCLNIIISVLTFGSLLGIWIMGFSN